ncbi:hypothetical protein [Salibacterium sp. K-3]
MHKSKNGFWGCSSCGSRTKDAPRCALQDYKELISPLLTTEQCRDFLSLPSSQVTLRLLSSLRVPHNRKNKGRIYHLSHL